MLCPAAHGVHEVEDPQDLDAVANHVPVAGLPPPKQAVPVHDEGGAVGHISFFVQHPVGADRDPVNVAQKRERNTSRPGELGEAKLAVAADRQQRGAALAQLDGDLTQVAEFRRSDSTPRVAEEGHHDVSPSLEFGKPHLAADA